MIETDSITIKESAQVLRKSESAPPAIVRLDCRKQQQIALMRLSYRKM